MNKQEAQHHFKSTISKPCPECKARAGDLCDTPAVWVHLERLLLDSTKSPEPRK